MAELIVGPTGRLHYILRADIINNNNNVRLTCQGQTNCMNLRHGQSLGEGIGSFSETES